MNDMKLYEEYEGEDGFILSVYTVDDGTWSWILRDGEDYIEDSGSGYETLEEALEEGMVVLKGV